jgi:MFS transporter, PAT family, beta-lactamase induction signal transducer AmpG
MSEKASRVPPVAWVLSLYLAMGIPYNTVLGTAATLFKNLGHRDGEITATLATIGLAWSLKPFWASFLDMYRTKKFWVLSMELLLAGLFGSVAAALSLPAYFPVIIVILSVAALASSTQDICGDGVYITSLNEKEQATWMGWQGAAWNAGRVFATSAVVILAGAIQKRAGVDTKPAWMIAFAFAAAVMAAFAVYHYFVLPTGSITRRPKDAAEVFATFSETVVDFVKKPKLWGMLIFVFLYRSGEGFLLVEAPLFMQAPLAEGGLGLTLEQKGFLDGAVATGVSLAAGVLGGMFISKFGLKKSLVFMALCMNVPHLCFVYLSQAVTPEAPLSLTTIATLVTIEKFGYSFGFVANMLYMVQQISPGKFHMTHYAFCSALMNLVLLPTQAASGYLADWLGYRNFFLFVMVASIPSVIAAYFAPFPREDQARGSKERGTGDAPGPAARAH